MRFHDTAGVNAGLDAVIIFSDILVIPVAMGMPCEMIPGKGPTFSRPLRPEDVPLGGNSKQDIISDLDLDLKPDVEKTLGYVFDAIYWTKCRIETEWKDRTVPVIGFTGAPWTLLGYMIEGGGSKTWANAKKWLYIHKTEAKIVLKALTDVIIEYLFQQYLAGASVLQVFDTNAGELTPAQYREFAVPELLRIASEVKAKIRAHSKEKGPCQVPMILFPKDVQPEVYALFDGEVGDANGYDVIGVGWKTDIGFIANHYVKKKVLQGNLDPCVLYGVEGDTVPQPGCENMPGRTLTHSNAVIEKETKQLLSSVPRGRHVCNLGHGMLPDFKPEALAAFIGAVKAEG